MADDEISADMQEIMSLVRWLQEHSGRIDRAVTVFDALTEMSKPDAMLALQETGALIAGAEELIERLRKLSKSPLMAPELRDSAILGLQDRITILRRHESAVARYINRH